MLVGIPVGCGGNDQSDQYFLKTHRDFVVAFELAAGTPDAKEARALLAEPNGVIPPHS